MKNGIPTFKSTVIINSSASLPKTEYPIYLILIRSCVIGNVERALHVPHLHLSIH